MHHLSQALVPVLRDGGGQLPKVRHVRSATGLDVDAPLVGVVPPHVLRSREYGYLAQSVCDHSRELRSVPARVRRCSVEAAGHERIRVV